MHCGIMMCLKQRQSQRKSGRKVNIPDPGKVTKSYGLSRPPCPPSSNNGGQLRPIFPSMYGQCVSHMGISHSNSSIFQSPDCRGYKKVSHGSPQQCVRPPARPPVSPSGCPSVLPSIMVSFTGC